MPQYRDEVVIQQHRYQIHRVAGFGFGLAVSGGIDNSKDGPVVISDVIENGPAFNKLMINDIVIEVNGISMKGVTHGQAVQILTESGRIAEINVRRKVIVKAPIPEPKPRNKSKSRVNSREPDSDSEIDEDRRSESRSGRSGRSRSRTHTNTHTSKSRHKSKTRDRTYDSEYDSYYDTRGGRTRSKSRKSYNSSSERSNSNSDYTNSDSYSDEQFRKKYPSPEKSKSKTTHTSDKTYKNNNNHQNQSRVGSYEANIRQTSHQNYSNNDVTSPISPDQIGEPTILHRTADTVVLPVKMPEATNIVLQKTKNNREPYGLKLGTRLVVADVIKGSLADKKGIKKGDTIELLNNEPTNDLTVLEATNLIKKNVSQGKLCLKIQRNSGATVTIPTTFSRPASPQPLSRQQSRGDDWIPGQQHIIQDNTTLSRGPSRGPSKGPSRAQSYGAGLNQIGQGVDMNAVAAGLSANLARKTISFIKAKTIGVRLCGGNLDGIYVQSVQAESPAALAGLQMGNKIVAVNGVPFSKKTREDAVLELMEIPFQAPVIMEIQPVHESIYGPILQKTAGDCFYVRAHFNYEGTGSEMPINRGSIYCIKDTMYKGQLNTWFGTEVNVDKKEIERGILPGIKKANQIKAAQDQKEQRLREKHGARKIKERLKGNTAPGRTNAKPSVYADYPAYENVVLRQATFPRPVVLFGALADLARAKLPEGRDGVNYQNTQVNANTRDNTNSNRRGVVKISSINSIIQMQKHPLVDITPGATEKLNKAKLYPIVIYLKNKSPKEVKNLRKRYATCDADTEKSNKKLLKRAYKVERGYKHIFTNVLDLSKPENDDMMARLRDLIKFHQNDMVWVNEEHDENDDENINAGDEDAVSMISVPETDYSCTTIGSNMGGSRLNLNDFSDSDEEEENRAPTGSVQSHATSSRQTENKSQSGSNTSKNSYHNSNSGSKEPYKPPVPILQNSNHNRDYNPPIASTRHNASNYYRAESDDDPPPPAGPAPIPPSKDYQHGYPASNHPNPQQSPYTPTTNSGLGTSVNPAGKALANVINNRAPETNNNNFLKNHINNLNKVQTQNNGFSSPDYTPPLPENKNNEYSTVHNSNNFTYKPNFRQDEYSGAAPASTGGGFRGVWPEKDPCFINLDLDLTDKTVKSLSLSPE